MKAVAWPVAGVAAVVALAVVGTANRSPAGPAHVPGAGSLAVTQTAVVCPNVNGTPTAPTTISIADASAAVPSLRGRSATVTTTPLTGPHARPQPVTVHGVSRSQVTTHGYAVLVQASGPAAAAVVADQSRLIPQGRTRALFSAPCISPGTDFWITGADGRVGYTDTLVLANPGSTVANLTITAWSTKGKLEPPRLQSFTVAAGSAFLLNVANYTPDAAYVALHVHANSGRIAAEALDSRISGIRPAGVDWIPPTKPPSTHAVVPGFVGGPGARRLLLANPGLRDATVSLRLSTTSGNFAPAGHQTVIVRAEQTVAVDLTSSFGGLPGAVILHSDEPVTAAAVSSAAGTPRSPLPDIQWQPAGLALTGPAVLADNTPPFGRIVKVYVTAPGRSARVRVSTLGGQQQTLTIRAGRTLPFDPEAAWGAAAYGPLVFTPLGGGPVYVSRTLFAFGAHGPLATSEQPTLLPRRIPLPAVVSDPHAAAP